MDLNRATLIGRLTRDPEARTTPTGKSVSSFGLATGRVWVDAAGQKQQKTEFHNIVAWGKLADICSQYLTKGRQIYLEGRIQTRDWQDANGNRRNRTEVVAENMIMLGSKGTVPTGTDAPAEEQAAPASETEAGEAGEIKVEDIPF